MATERHNDKSTIFGIILCTFGAIIGLYIFLMFSLYSPPKAKETKNADETNDTSASPIDNTVGAGGELSDLLNNEQADEKFTVASINSIEGDLKNSFKTIGIQEGCREIKEAGVNGTAHLSRFTRDFGATISFEDEKSAYSSIDGTAMIDDSAITMHKIILSPESREKAYILMEIPYTIKCTKVSDDQMYDDFKKYENTEVGSGDLFAVVTLKGVTVENNSVKSDGFPDRRIFFSKEEAEAYIESLCDTNSKSFDF